MLSKKLYYSYLLNYTDEYWRNIYLKFKEKIRKTSLLVMTINNVFYKAHIKTNRTNRTNRTTRTSHTNPSSDITRPIDTNSSSDTTRPIDTNPSSDTIRPIDTNPSSDTNKGNKCIPYDNFMHLVIKMKAKLDEKFINSIRTLLAKVAYKSKDKQLKHKGKAMLEKLITKERKKIKKAKPF